MIKIQFQRLLKRKSFYIVFFILLLLTSLNAITNNNIRVPLNDFVNYANGVYYNFILYTPGKHLRLIQAIFPLLAAVPFSDCYLEDINSGFIKNIITRYDKKKYLTVTFVCNFIFSGLIISIPFIVNYMIYASFIPSIQPKIFFNSTFDNRSFLPYIYHNFPLLHVFLRILLLFVYAGVFSNIALAASIFFKNKYIVTIFPFIIYICLDIFVSIDYSPLAYLFNSFKYNSMYLIYPIVFTITCFFIFIIGGLKHESV